MEDVVGNADLVGWILSFLPFTKQKVALQRVCKTWQQALYLPAAHTIKAEVSDWQHDLLPSSGEVDGRPFISQDIIKVLKQCTLGGADSEGEFQGSISWLPCGLEWLKCSHAVIYSDFVADLPFMENLKYLDIHAEEFGTYDLATKMPNLEGLRWSSAYSAVMPSHLERLANLKECWFEVWECKVEGERNVESAGSMGPLPDGCCVHWFAVGLLEHAINFPEGLIGQITMLRLCGLYGYAEEELLDFRWVREMSSLQHIRLSNMGPELRVTGLEFIPASCKNLIFETNLLRVDFPFELDVDMSACVRGWVMVQVPEGWKLTRRP